LKKKNFAINNKPSVESVKETLKEIDGILENIERRQTEATKWDLTFDATVIQQSLGAINQITTFGELSNWDNEAKAHLSNLTLFMDKMNALKKQIDDEINFSRSSNIFKNFTIKSRILANYGDFYKQFPSHSKFLQQLKSQLEFWLQIVPSSFEELKNIKQEFKEQKQLLNLRKKELSIGRKKVWAHYRTESSKIHFNSSQVRNTLRGLRKLDREKSLDPIDAELDFLTLQLNEIDKILIWLNRIKQ
jgi:hypothetical protein